MADLLDISPSTACEVVKFDGNRIIVRGLNSHAIAAIAVRFPEIIGLLFGAGANIGPRLISQLGGAIPAFIAAGVGHLGDEEYEKRAGAFVFEYQVNIVAAVLRVTFPNGLISFVETLAALAKQMGADEGAIKPVKVRLRKSPSISPPSSDAASHPNMQ